MRDALVIFLAAAACFVALLLWPLPADQASPEAIAVPGDLSGQASPATPHG